MTRNRKTYFRLLVTFLFLLGGTSAGWAESVIYLDQAAFENALAAMGFLAVHEGFENDAAWSSTRTTGVTSVNHQYIFADDFWFAFADKELILAAGFE